MAKTKGKASQGLQDFNKAVDDVLQDSGIDNRKSLYRRAKRRYNKNKKEGSTAKGIAGFNDAVDEVLENHGIKNRKALYRKAKLKYKKDKM